MYKLLNWTLEIWGKPLLEISHFIIFDDFFSTGHVGVYCQVRSFLAFCLCFPPPSQHLASFSLFPSPFFTSLPSLHHLYSSLILFPSSFFRCSLLYSFHSPSTIPFLSLFIILSPPSPPHSLTGRSFAGRHQWCWVPPDGPPHYIISKCAAVMMWVWGVRSEGKRGWRDLALLQGPHQLNCLPLVHYKLMCTIISWKYAHRWWTLLVQ